MRWRDECEALRGKPSTACLLVHRHTADYCYRPTWFHENHVRLMITQLMSFVDAWVLHRGAQRDGTPQQIAEHRRVSARG